MRALVRGKCERVSPYVPIWGLYVVGSTQISWPMAEIVITESMVSYAPLARVPPRCFKIDVWSSDVQVGTRLTPRASHM